MMAVAQDMRWRLSDLLDGFASAPAIAINDIALASAEVRAGGVFFAFQGTARHGIEFADEAIRRGAVAIVTDLDADDPRVAERRSQLPVVSVAGGRAVIGQIAARFYGNPTAAMQVIATTGTNGKSSISWLVAEALEQSGSSCAVLGTLGAGRTDRLSAQALTTPDAIAIQREAARLRDEGIGALAMEASSHAIDQQRLAGCDVDVAIFSNLSRDHLDYHGDLERYFEAKAALFTLDTLSQRIICTDDAAGERLWQRHRDNAIRVARELSAEARRHGPFVTADSVTERADGTRIAVASHAGDALIESTLIGSFNVQNLLLAFAALIALELSPAAAARALGAAHAPPGRMQRVADVTPAVYVDFAHSPDALSNALAALRPLCRGRLWCVFGCGGDRDRGKRPQMAAAAGAHADMLVVTSDNPRSEAPQAIIDDVLAGVTGRADVHVDVDRRRAIGVAVAQAADDDIVLIAGKGHERTQLVGGQALPFDDVNEARLALARRRQVTHD